MALQVEVPCHDEPLLLVHLLTAGEPGTADRHIATLPLLVLPEAACDEVGGQHARHDYHPPACQA
jgi:hypothetical protein